MAKSLHSLKEFFKLEAAAGIILFFAAVLAVIAANSGLKESYHAFLHFPIHIHIGEYGLQKTAEHWINDGLMAVFFFLVGMEMKREVKEGELASIGQALLPAVAAAGGVVLPSLIYAYFNWGDALAIRGWAIPSATDIAFSLAVLSLFGSRVPIALKIFLMAVAVIDDLIAIIIIAVFYTSGLTVSMLGYASIGLLGLIILNVLKVRHVSLYVLFGLVMWFCVLKSGVHATIAGVVCGLLIPITVNRKKGGSMLHSLIHDLHPYVAFFILPVFAFANAGVSLEGLSFSSLLEPVPLGVMLGLFFGKQLGIFSFSWVLIKSGFAKLPSGVSWLQMYGVAAVAGIGFTMSLFIGGLAFGGDKTYAVYKTLGVLVGSLCSAIFGYLIIYISLKKNNKIKQKQ